MRQVLGQAHKWSERRSPVIEDADVVRTWPHNLNAWDLLFVAEIGDDGCDGVYFRRQETAPPRLADVQ
ncbi:MAG: hypothetical protein WAR24_07640 [Candidatus Acidiferrales bacterium]